MSVPSLSFELRLLRPAGVLVLALLASCAGRSRWPRFSTQQYPGPMEAAVDPLPPGTEKSWPPGPEEVVIHRLADPVQLRPAGEAAAFPLRFFDKRRRTNSGAWVFSAAGGRAQVLWPSGSSAVLFDRCTAIVGSPSRGEPNLILREIERVVLNLTTGDQVELLGGAQLAANSGPWLVERRLFEILRVKNQSKESGEVSYRDEVFTLSAGETLDLPLLSAGGRPIPETPNATRVLGPGFEVEVVGGVEAESLASGVRLVGRGEHEISGLGIRLHLDEGEQALLGGLSADSSVLGTPEASAGPLLPDGLDPGGDELEGTEPAALDTDEPRAPEADAQPVPDSPSPSSLQR